MQDREQEGREYLPLFVSKYPEAKKYFSSANNHCQIWFDGYNWTNALFINCTNEEVIAVKKERQLKLSFNLEDAGDKHRPERYRDRGYAQFSRCEIEKSDDAPSELLHLTDMNGKHIGYLLPDINVLYVCDLTHTLLGVDLLWKIIEALHSQGLLEEVNTVNEHYEIPEITLGADPEFELMANGCAVDLRSDEDNGDVSAYFRDEKLGVDGSGHQVELRPDPADSPKQFVENMRSIFSSMVPKEDVFSVGGRYFPLGGHIHIGVGHPIDPPKNLITLFDYFIGQPTLKLSGEARGQYCRLGQYRTQPHGFEYRTPPSAIFGHPTMTLVTMKLAQQIMQLYFKRHSFWVNPTGEPSVEELMQVGLTEGEASYYLDYIKKFKEQDPYKYNIASYWDNKKFKKTVPKVKKAAPNLPPNFNIQFSDDWEPVIRIRLTEAVRSIRTTRRSVPVRFFGLAEQRGLVCCGLDIRGFSATPYPQGGNPQYLLLAGLPFAFRMGRLESSQVEQIISDIKRAIRSRLRSLPSDCPMDVRSYFSNQSSEREPRGVLESLRLGRVSTPPPWSQDTSTTRFTATFSSAPIYYNTVEQQCGEEVDPVPSDDSERDGESN
jgi:hypothetical protein